MNELRALTALRGLAAFYVVLLHFSSAVQRHTDGVIPALAPRGHLAVDFFFVLSGFIMAYSYASDFRARGPSAIPSFLLKRVARVMPLHWFVTILVLAYTLAVSPGFSNAAQPAFNTQHPFRDVAMNLLLLQGTGLAPNMNGPSWSISVEMFAYFAFPLFLLAFRSRKKPVRYLAIGLTLMALIVTAMQSPQLSLDTAEAGWTFARGFSEFGLGVAAYSVYRSGRFKELLGSDRLILGAALLALSMMFLRLWDLVAVLTFPAIILGMAHNQGNASRLLSARFPHFLGEISFSLYLIHFPIAYLQLQALKYFHPELLAKPSALMLAALGSLTIIPMAWVVYNLVEHPGRAWIRGIAERMQGKPQVTVRA